MREPVAPFPAAQIASKTALSIVSNFVMKAALFTFLAENLTKAGKSTGV